MLQQSSAFGPFMREFVVLAEIAGRASNNQIIRVARPAARNRHDVVKMVVLAYLCVAVVATAFLALVLGLDDRLINYASGATAMLRGPDATWMSVTVLTTPLGERIPCAFRIGLCPAFCIRIVLVCMLGVVLAPSFPDLLRMCHTVFARLLLNMLRVLEIVLAISFYGPFRVFTLPLGHVGIGTGFTPVPQAVAVAAVPVEMLRRCREIVTASRAALERIGDIQHSAPHYAGSHDVCSQNGVSAVRSGATLGYTLNYTTKRGISWLLQEAN